GPPNTSKVDNACIDAPVRTPDGFRSWIPVNEIYIYQPSVLDRATKFLTTRDLLDLKGERELWARKGPDQAEPKDAPAPKTPPTVTPPDTKPTDGCVTNNANSPAQKAFHALLSEEF